MTRNFIAPSQKRPSVPWPAVFRRLGDDFSPQSPRKGPWRQESQCPFFACNEDWPVIFTSEVAPYSVGKMSVYLHVQIQKHMHQCTTMHNTPIPIYVWGGKAMEGLLEAFIHLGIYKGRSREWIYLKLPR